ncbi:MAG: hypothetical protein IJB70_04750 [Clostridia bacterium]|nr:hypothetical protein [Clostridia bacterium]
MKIGFLPLYTSLYSKKPVETRLQPFYDTLAKAFEKKGLEVVKNEFCMEAPDFEKAVAKFEAEGCDAIVTLHAAYSPGLCSEKPLANTKLPIIIFDTTETFDFSDNQQPSEITYCHGIHGVMEMCNLLKKNGKPYAIAAGHYIESDVTDRVVGLVKAAVSANAVKGSVVGSVSGYFDGMGDFRVSDDKMEELFGAKVIYPENGELKELMESVTEKEIEAEKEKNKNNFEFADDVDENAYTRSVTCDIAIRKWIEKRNLSALTINFRELGDLYTMPFNAACRAMEAGIGYAGEGDTLTALFTGAFLKGYKETSFIEIFCPDWKNNTLFISHMGEMNYAVADRKKILWEMKFAYGNETTTNPYVVGGAFKEGKALFLNVFEDENGFNILTAPVNVVKETTDIFEKKVRGWLDFGMPTGEALEKISLHGATHHSILVYGAREAEIEFFAKLAGIKYCSL